MVLNLPSNGSFLESFLHQWSQAAPRESAAANSAGQPTGKLKLAKELRDGTKLCEDYGLGKCKGKECPKKKGKHMCPVILAGGRVCGAKNHVAKDCTAKGKQYL